LLFVKPNLHNLKNNLELQNIINFKYFYILSILQNKNLVRIHLKTTIYFKKDLKTFSGFIKAFLRKTNYRNIFFNKYYYLINKFKNKEKKINSICLLKLKYLYIKIKKKYEYIIKKV